MTGHIHSYPPSEPSNFRRPLWVRAIAAAAFGGLLLSATPTRPASAAAEPSLPQRSSTSPAHPAESVQPESAGHERSNAATRLLADVRIEGNTSVSEQEIRRYIRSRPSRPVDMNLIQEDVRQLQSTPWFYQVEPLLREGPDGPVLLFRVVERPLIEEVVYLGNKALKTKDLETLTGLRVGGPMDPAVNRRAVRRIEDRYRERGYALAEVELVEGTQPRDRRVVFQIVEGEKVRVRSVSFGGNSFVSESVLATKILTKPRFLRLFGGKYDPSSVDDDVDRLKAYYHSLGFFDVQTGVEKRFNTRGNWVDVTFFVEEGPRYQVRSIEFVGNERFDTETLKETLKLRPGESFSQHVLVSDIQRIQEMYGSLGYYYAQINAEPRFFREPAILDLVYEIKEGQPYKVRHINVVIKGDNPRTQERVVRNLLTLQPGEILDTRQLRKSEQRLRGSQLFRVDPAQGIGPRIQVVEPVQDDPSPALVQSQYLRGQDEEADLPGLGLPEPFSVPFDQPPPGERDIGVFLEEAQTGRFMVGVGVNSNSGVLGSIVLDERNFDIARYPRGFDDFLDGTAFRGAGQELRMEALPGSELSRYLVSFREPYLFDLPFSFGVSGYFFQRFFHDWDEERLGGRFSLGHAFTDELALNVGLRLENVEIDDPDIPTPPDLARVLGDNFLGVARFALVHDTRDSPFLPSEGHYVEAAYEQGFGDFTFPRGTLEGRQYFTLRQRPDGTGRQVLALRGIVGVTGNNTPIFERFFAGGFHTLRGFDYRGASPRVFDVRVGGEFEMLGSVEYEFPLTADDTLRAVTFVDFGTIEESVKLESEDFRVSLGAGLRIVVPALGPVPIALDFAVPIAREDGDDIEIFSFWIGFLR